ncbi:MAG TPA: cell envelope integrity protein TolA [Gammaproteobacteria bacterium]|nr:cell envelope integrity protein TolA [Gammaproteobacteria bacterium]
MLKLVVQHPVAVFVAVVVHLVFIAILVVSFDWSEPAEAPSAQVEVVQAVAVDEAQVERELRRIKEAERQRIRRAKELEAQRRKEERRLARIKKEQAEAQRRQAELERQRKAKAKAERERLARLKKEKEALEDQRRAEEERLREAEAQRRAEEERARLAEQQRREEELRRKLEEEAQAREAEARARAQATEIRRFRDRIYAEVYQAWIPPKSAPVGMYATVQVRLIPSGEVVRVTISRSSGNNIFDDSVTRAVKKASPLSVPPADSGLFDQFRELTLKLTKRPNA